MELTSLEEQHHETAPAQKEDSQEAVAVATEASTTTTTEGKRRRPVQQPDDDESTTTKPRSRTRTTTEKAATTTRTRRPRPQAVNDVSSGESDSKAGGSSGSRRRLNSNRRGSTTAAPDVLSSRQGLADERSKADTFDLDGLIDLSTDSPAVKTSNEADDEDHVSFSQRPTNSRFPSRFQSTEDEQEDDIQQGRTPLRVVDSSSFRNSAGGSSAEQHTSGRLTVLSGPARLPPAQTAHEDDDLESSKAPLIIQAEVITASEEAENNAAAHQPTEELEAPHEDEAEQKPSQPLRPSPSSRPDLIDLLAFSRAVEQQQQDEQSTDTPAAGVIEDVHIEEVHPVKVSEDTEVHQEDTPSTSSTTTTTVATTIAELDQVSSTTEPIDVVVKTAETEAAELPAAALPADSVESDDDAHPVTEAEDAEIPTTTEPLSTTTTSTTTTTTQATTTKTTTTTTTPAPEGSTGRVRGQNRFGANSNRIRNRTRDGVTTAAPDVTSSTSSAPSAVRRPAVNNFSNSRGTSGSGLNRLRRPSTTAAPEVSADGSSGESSGSNSTTAAPASRRPISPNIRNRFNIRRGEEAAGSGGTTAPPAVTSERAPVSPRTRPSQPPNRVISARPSILTRGRTTTSTTTTTTAPVPGDASEEANSSTDSPSSGGSEDAASSSSTTTSTTTEATTTTTSRSAGLNRLRNRVSLAVSERPKPVRNQVSLNERRNRFTALNTKKASEEEEASKAVSSSEGSPSTQASTSAAAPVEDESLDHSAESSNISPVALRSLRHNLRRPGQLAAVNRRAQPSS